MWNSITVIRTENDSEFEFRLRFLAYISLSNIARTGFVLLLCVNRKLDCVAYLMMKQVVKYSLLSGKFYI